MELKIDALIEFQKKINGNIIELKAQLNEIEKLTYDYILPLGKNCLPELILRKLNLYGEASPFGAMHNFAEGDSGTYEKYKKISGTHGFKGKMELIINDFKNYFEIGDLEVIRDNDGVLPDNPNMVIGNKKTGLIIYHTFPMLDGGIESYYQTAKNHFDGRVESFRAKMKSARKILIVFMDCNWNIAGVDYSQSYNKCEHIENDIILKQSKRLQKVYPEKRIHYLFLEHDNEKSENEIEKIRLNNSIIKFRANHCYLDKNIIWRQSENNYPAEYGITAISKILSKISIGEFDLRV
jgi:hypothetical protein